MLPAGGKKLSKRVSQSAACSKSNELEVKGARKRLNGKQAPENLWVVPKAIGVCSVVASPPPAKRARCACWDTESVESVKEFARHCGRTCEVRLGETWSHGLLKSVRRHERGLAYAIQMVGDEFCRIVENAELKFLEAPHADLCRPGTACKAIFPEDGLWCDGIIMKQAGVSYEVHFTHYRLHFLVPADHIRLSGTRSRVRDQLPADRQRRRQIALSPTDELFAEKQRIMSLELPTPPMVDGVWRINGSDAHQHFGGCKGMCEIHHQGHWRNGYVQEVYESIDGLRCKVILYPTNLFHDIEAALVWPLIRPNPVLLRPSMHCQAIHPKTGLWCPCVVLQRLKSDFKVQLFDAGGTAVHVGIEHLRLVDTQTVRTMASSGRILGAAGLH